MHVFKANEGPWIAGTKCSNAIICVIDLGLYFQGVTSSMQSSLLNSYCKGLYIY